MTLLPAHRGAHSCYHRLDDLLAPARLSVKLEGLNPSGSIKAKAAQQMLLEAESSGRLRPGARLIESSSGNLGVALASLCAARGYRLTVVIDPNTNARTAQKLRALGADVVVVDARDAAGGFLASRIAYIQQAVLDDADLVWLNQYVNPANSAAHQHLTMREIVADFGVPDWLVIGVGTSGTLMGCLAGIRELRLATRVVAVEPTGSVIFGGAPGRRHIPGIGASRVPELFVDSPDFAKIRVDEVDAVRMCRRVARDHGLLLGGSTGSVLAAATRLTHHAGRGDRVLAISPDMGDAYLDTIYNDAWVAQTFGGEALLGDRSRTLEGADHA